MKCDICGKDELLPYKCSYCGGTFCSDHRLPEKHSCEGLYDIPVKVKRDRDIGRRQRSRIAELQKYDPELKVRKNPFEIYGYNNMILAIITVLFALTLIFRPLFNLLALYPYDVYLRPWQLITSIFLHGSFEHYFVNALVLFFFGTELERRVGGKKYLEIFLLSGIFGNVMYVLFSYASGTFTPAVGASGAIYGVMGALAIMAPEIRVLLFFFIPMNIRMAVLLFALYNLLMTPFSLFTGVAYIAHLGGLVVGLYYGDRLRMRRRLRL
ncbi:rhomboid family intramembrane serine protease [Geoglobus acetivorans]|uniref:Rhomboid family intramembrane serine protease n=1 Tax=Geoglobus acetivorans TaxID=565033 RepID=A0ABZ3H2T7_GEOAI|nr:rhomboid family intramembrane serine protease [Geoglobus acetivorans]